MRGIYPKILRQAFHLAKSHKLFWKAGLFLVWPNLLRGLLAIGLVATWFQWGQNALVQESEVQPISPWLSLGALLVIGLLLIYYFRSKAVVVLAVKQLQDKPQLDQKKIHSQAEPHVGSYIKFGLATVSTLGILTAFLLSPVLYLSAHDYAIRAGILGALAIFAYVPIIGLFYCVMVFGPMFMAAHYLSSWDSARASADVFRANWLFLAGLWLILLAVELAGLAISVGLMFLASAPFVLLTQIFYDGGGSGDETTLQALAGIVVFMVFFMSQAAIAAYQRVAWAVAFFEIVRPVKMDEADEPETVPEVIS